MKELQNYFEYAGALHVHSSFSDGSGSIEEIAQAAKEAHLHFVGITDHNTLRALNEVGEGYHNEVFFIIGCEINDKFNKNHYLAFNIKETPSTRLPAKDYVRSVREQGGIGFIAHPFEKRTSFKEHPPYPWIDWDIDEFDGIEIWNHMSEWMENLNNDNKYDYFLHPLRYIKKPCEDALKKWDELNLKRKVVAMGGVDAHAHKVNILGFVEVEVFPYKVMFKSIRTYVLLKEELSADKNKIQNNKIALLKALKKGNSYIANYYRGDPSGFRFWAKYKNRIYIMGDDIVPEGDDYEIELFCFQPGEKAKIVLLRNGGSLLENAGKELYYVAKEKGNYRIEVYKENYGWIFSNHIRIL